MTEADCAKTSAYSAEENITEINLGLRMIQPRGGFSFGTDALLLAAFVRPRKYGSAADFGSGCGAVSLLCAAAGKFKNITAFEVQSEYARLCGENAALNELSHVINVREEDIRTLREGREKFTAVFTNPPYMRADGGRNGDDPGRSAARHELHGGIDDFCAAAAASLDSGGYFYAVYRPDRAAELISSMRTHGIEPKRLCMVQRDERHEPCLILAEGMRGGSPSLRFMPTLMLVDSDGNMTERTKKIYDTMEFYE